MADTYDSLYMMYSVREYLIARKWSMIDINTDRNTWDEFNHLDDSVRIINSCIDRLNDELFGIGFTRQRHIKNLSK